MNDTQNLTLLRSEGSTLLETQPSTAKGAVPKNSPGDSMQFWTLERFALVLGLALLAAFPLVATGSHTFFYRDFGAMWYPVNVYTRDSLLSGEIPLWNPYIHCGVPFQAQMGQWYPPMLVALFLPMPWSMNALLLAHLFFGGLGVFWLVRRWGVGGFAAGFAGMAFVFNGVMLSSLLWLSYIACLAWMPWLVGCVVEAWTKGGRWLVLAALVSAMQVLSGMPELTAMTWLLIFGLWINFLVTKQAPIIGSATRTAGIIVLAAGITMIQMLPFFDLVSHSQRHTNYATDAWSMPAWGLGNLLAPLFHCYKGPQGNWFQSGQDLLPSYYLGVAPLLLAFIGVVIARNRGKWAIVSMLVFCWLMAMGAHGVLYGGLRTVVPQLGFMRYPVKFAIFPVLLIPILAAWAIEHMHVQDAKKSRRFVFAAGGISLLLMAAILLFARAHALPNDQWPATALNTLCRALLMCAILAGLVYAKTLTKPSNQIAVQFCLLLLIPLDAMTHSPNIAPTLPSSVMAQGMWEASGKPTPPKLGQGRIMLSAAAENSLLYSYVEDLKTDFTGKRLAEWYNLSLLDRVPKVNGAVPLHPAHYDFLENHLYYKSGAKYGSPLLDFLSVAWFSSDANAVQWTPRTSYLPVVTAGQKPLFASAEQTLEAITSDDFKPKNVVYLPEATRSIVAASNAVNCELTGTEVSAHRIETDVSSPEATMLVVSQTYYHLWQAFVDGVSVPLFRANVAFQALEIPAGKHHVKIIYKDHNLSFGALLTAIFLALCVFLWWKSPGFPSLPFVAPIFNRAYRRFATGET